MENVNHHNHHITNITTSPRHHITTSPHHHVTTSPHHHITTSPRHHITTSQHHHITSPCPHVPTSPHLTHHPITSHHHITSCFINLQSSHCRSQWDRFVKLTLVRVETHKTHQNPMLSRTKCFLVSTWGTLFVRRVRLCEGIGRILHLTVDLNKVNEMIQCAVPWCLAIQVRSLHWNGCINVYEFVMAISVFLLKKCFKMVFLFALVPGSGFGAAISVAVARRLKVLCNPSLQITAEWLHQCYLLAWLLA